MGQQQSAQLSPPLLGRFVEGRERPLVRGVDARVVLDQQGGDVHVLDAGEEEEAEVRKRKRRRKRRKERRAEKRRRGGGERRNSNKSISQEQMCDAW